MTRYHIALRRARQWLFNFELLGAVIFTLGFLAIFFFEIFRLDAWNLIATSDFWRGEYARITRFAYLAFLSIAFLTYRFIAGEERVGEMPPEEKLGPEALNFPEPGAITWSMVRKIRKKRQINIANVYALSARLALERAHGIWPDRVESGSAQSASDDFLDLRAASHCGEH